MRCDSICCTVSSATPTTISRPVPPNENGTLKLLLHERRQHADRRDVERAAERDARQHAVDVLGGLLARANARDEAAVLLQVVGDVDRVERDRRVEVAEEDDERRRRRRCSASRPAAARRQIFCIQRDCMKLASCAGNIRIDEAKIGGMTPATLTLSGRCVDCPPYIFRPTTRLAYWTGICRCPRSKKMIAAMTPTTMRQDR